MIKILAEDFESPRLLSVLNSDDAVRGYWDSILAAVDAQMSGETKYERYQNLRQFRDHVVEELAKRPNPARLDPADFPSIQSILARLPNSLNPRFGIDCAANASALLDHILSPTSHRPKVGSIPPVSLQTITLHDEIIDMLKARTRELSGRILVLNLDSHNDFDTGPKIGSRLIPGTGNWGIRVEKLCAAKYLWLKSFFLHPRFSLDNWASPANLSAFLTQFFQVITDHRNYDIKEIWLTIDADAYSLRHRNDWERIDFSGRRGMDMREDAIRMDLANLKTVLDYYRIPVSFIVLATSPGYLNKSKEQIPGFIRLLSRIISNIFIQPPPAGPGSGLGEKKLRGAA